MVGLPGKTMTCIPIGGLANRSSTIIAAIDFCKDYHLKLKIIWFKDWGMGAAFRDLFTVSEEAGEVEIVDAHWYHYFLDRPRKRTLWLPWIYQRIKFDACFYEKELYRQIPFEQWFEQHSDSRSFYVVNYMRFYNKGYSFRYLFPIESIQEEIEKQVNELPNHTIGIHIRRTDNVQAIQKSPVSLFIEKMKEEMEKDPAVYFYVASDSMEVKETLINNMGGGKNYYPGRESAKRKERRDY
jgi:hypothetical protein